MGIISQEMRNIGKKNKNNNQKYNNFIPLNNFSGDNYVNEEHFSTRTESLGFKFKALRLSNKN